MKTDNITNVDTVIIEIENKYCKIVVGLIYWPPRQTLDIYHALGELELETSNSCEAVIMLNFNLPVQRWGEPLNSQTGDLYQH